MTAAAVLGVVLAACAVALGALAVVAARPPHRAPPSFDAYLHDWSPLHGGYRPSGVARSWLRLAFVAARPLAARGVRPDVVTAGGVLVAAFAVVPVLVGGRWVVLAALLVALSGLADSIDGAVAVATGRSSRFGYVVDSLADRVADGVYLLAFALLGAPVAVCGGAGAALVLLEYTRARAAGVGFTGIGVVTVGERPTRVVLHAVALLAAGLLSAHGGVVVTAGAAAVLGACALGLVQLLVVMRRDLS